MQPARELPTRKQPPAVEPHASAVEPLLEAPAAVSPTVLSVLRLQRVAGNTATRNLIQRPRAADRRLQRAPDAGTPSPPSPVPDAGAPPPPLSFDVIQIVSGSGTPSLSGRVTASPSPDGPDGSGSVRLNGPEVRVPETVVGLGEGVTLGNGVGMLVGYTQSVVSSERIALYQPAGGGSPIEVHTELGTSRDAAVGDEPTGGRHALWAETFYLPPGVLSDVHKEVTPQTRLQLPPNPDLFDRPGFAAARVLGTLPEAPRLVGFKGSDHYVHGLQARYASDRTLFTLTATHWEVDWTTTLDPKTLAGSGAAGTLGPSAVPPPKTDGDIAALAAGKHWISFPDVAGAMHVSTRVLLANLAPSKASDPTSYSNTIEALRAKNPNVGVKIRVNSTDSIFSADTLTLELNGPKGKHPEPFKLNDGQEDTAICKLLELLDPAAVDASTTISVSVIVGRHRSDNAWQLPFPYLSQDIAVGSGKYRLSGGVQP